MSSNNRTSGQGDRIGRRGGRDRDYGYQGTSPYPFDTSSYRPEDDATQYGWQAEARWVREDREGRGSISSFAGGDRDQSDLSSGGHRGKGPKGYTRSDERLLDEVNDRLTQDHFLDASNVEVTVEGGEVTFSGYVTTRAEKRRAEDLADSVTGVSHVQNNLRVRQPSAD